MQSPSLSVLALEGLNSKEELGLALALGVNDGWAKRFTVKRAKKAAKRAGRKVRKVTRTATGYKRSFLRLK
jgi:hypothetical protein